MIQVLIVWICSFHQLLHISIFNTHTHKTRITSHSHNLPNSQLYNELCGFYSTYRLMCSTVLLLIPSQKCYDKYRIHHVTLNVCIEQRWTQQRNRTKGNSENNTKKEEHQTQYIQFHRTIKKKHTPTKLTVYISASCFVYRVYDDGARYSYYIHIKCLFRALFMTHINIWTVWVNECIKREYTE